MKTKNLIQFIVFGVVTNDGDMYAFIFSYDFRLNVEAYIKYLLEIVKLWIHPGGCSRTTLLPSTGL